MATLSFGVSGSEQNWTTEIELSAQDSVRTMTYLMSPASGYGVVVENVKSNIPDASWAPGEGETEEDRPTIEVQEWVSRPATPEEAAQNFARATLVQLLNQTVVWEKAEAAKAAAEAIPPIVPVT